MKESVIEKYLVAQVKAAGGEVRKVQWIGRRGAPDRLVLLPYSPFSRGLYQATKPSSTWVELKAPGAEPESHQVREHDRLRAFGEHVEVIDSIQAVDRLLS